MPDSCWRPIDGVSLEAVKAATWAGMQAAAGKPGIRRITAGNYGGKLGPFHIHLRELWEGK